MHKHELIIERTHQNVQVLDLRISAKLSASDYHKRTSAESRGRSASTPAPLRYPIHELLINTTEHLASDNLQPLLACIIDCLFVALNTAFYITTNNLAHPHFPPCLSSAAQSARQAPILSVNSQSTFKMTSPYKGIAWLGVGLAVCKRVCAASRWVVLRMA